MTDPPPPYEGPFVVLQLLGSIRLPLALYGPKRELLHAQPKSAFTRFDSREDAEAAIARALRSGRGKREDFAILPARVWSDDVEARESKVRKRSGRSPPPPPEEES